MYVTFMSSGVYQLHSSDTYIPYAYWDVYIFVAHSYAISPTVVCMKKNKIVTRIATPGAIISTNPAAWTKINKIHCNRNLWLRETRIEIMRSTHL